MTHGQQKRLIIMVAAVCMVLATIIPAITAIDVRMAAVDIGIGQETYQYVEHDHDWEDELTAAEAEIAAKNPIANWYVGLTPATRAEVAITSWVVLVIALVFLYNAVIFEIDYRKKRKRAIKVRPVAY